jgi:hypothetical protein
MMATRPRGSGSTAIGEALEGAAARRLFCRAIDDDGGLLVVVDARRDAERLPQLRARAVRRDHEAGADYAHLALGRHAHRYRVRADVEADDLGRRDARKARLRGLRLGSQRLPERPPQHPVLDRVAERVDTLLPRIDPRRAEAPALADMNEADRLGLVPDGVPEAELLEHALRAVRERRRAAVEARTFEGIDAARLDQHGFQGQTRERVREQGTDEAAADDQHIAVGRGSVRHQAAAMKDSTSATLVGMPVVSTCGPSRVTSTSSSMRMPMPRQRFAAPVAPAAT